MESTNYNHLFYFWTVARHGSVSKASLELGVSQPTISEQLGKLQECSGVQLFEREGRGIRLSAAGQVMFGYADQMFRLGREMKDALSGRPSATATRLALGITRSMPQMLVHKLLAPIFRIDAESQLSCLEDQVQELVVKLSLRRLDCILSDVAVARGNSRVHTHVIGKPGISFLAASNLKLRGQFPRSLDAAPFLMPGPNSELYRLLENWFRTQRVQPRVIGEFADAALLEAFGEDGLGIFAVPTMIEREARAKYKVRLVGRTSAIRQRVYAITSERTITNPLLMKIVRVATGR